MSKGKRNRAPKKVHKNKYESQSQASGEVERLSKKVIQGPATGATVIGNYSQTPQPSYNSSSYRSDSFASQGSYRSDSFASQGSYRPSSVSHSTRLESQLGLSSRLRSPSSSGLDSRSSRGSPRPNDSEIDVYPEDDEWGIISDRNWKFYKREETEPESLGFLREEVAESYRQLKGLVHQDGHFTTYARIFIKGIANIVEVYKDHLGVNYVITLASQTRPDFRTNLPQDISGLRTGVYELQDLTR